MSSTIDQLQQLTDNEVCILCYNYFIAPRHVANLNRRQLERRLHVAIIKERAVWRANHLLHGNAVEPYQRDNPYAWQRDDSLYNDDRPRISLDEWGYLVLREQARQRFGGGNEQKKLALYEAEEQEQEQEKQQQLQWQEQVVEEPQSEASVDIETQIEPDSEPLVAKYEMKLRIEVMENFAEPASDPATDYYSICSCEDSRSRSSSSIGGTLEPSSHCQVYPLQKSQHFTGCDLMGSEPRPEPQTETEAERELCTITYVTQDQLLAIESSSEPVKVKDDDHVGDGLSSTQTCNRRRPGFWRYILTMLWCNPQGKLDLHKLRYSFLCCAFVVCTYVGVKMMQ